MLSKILKIYSNKLVRDCLLNVFYLNSSTHQAIGKVNNRMAGKILNTTPIRCAVLNHDL